MASRSFNGVTPVHYFSTRVTTADNSVELDKPLCKLIKIPTIKIKFVIGKGGCVIKSIQSQSGTKIDVQENGQIQITGFAENIKMAKKLIKSISRKSEQKTILIPGYATGYLIGSQGKTINTLTEITGASVSIVNKRKDVGTGTEVRVILGGTEKQIRRAEELILTFVSGAKQKGKVRLEEGIESVGISEINGDPKCQPPTSSTSTPPSKPKMVHPVTQNESVKNLAEKKNGKNSIKSISRKFERKTILISQYTMGNLIGSKGKNIQKIKERSGASVNTLDKQEDVGPGSGIRLILGGSNKQIKRAEELIMTFVSQTEKNREAKLEETIKLAEMSEIYGDPDWQPQPPSSSTSGSTAPTKTRKPKVAKTPKRQDENVKLNSEKNLVANKNGKKKKDKNIVIGKEVFTNIPV